MRTIWKFDVTVQDEVTLRVPTGGQFVACAAQDPRAADEFQLWAEVDSLGELEDRVLHLYGTGHALEGDGAGERYVGTAMCAHGALVWHVYEVVA